MTKPSYISSINKFSLAIDRNLFNKIDPPVNCPSANNQANFDLSKGTLVFTRS